MKTARMEMQRTRYLDTVYGCVVGHWDWREGRGMLRIQFVWVGCCVASGWAVPDGGEWTDGVPGVGGLMDG